MSHTTHSGSSEQGGDRKRTLRLFHLGRMAVEQYQAFRRFSRLTEEERARHRDTPRRFVQSLLDMGPLFVKLGQILSTRSDVLPKEYIAELALLQERVPPFPFEQIRTTIQEQFGKTIEELFRSFEEAPIASASLAQVHLAELPDGTPVAVKIQCPHIREQMLGDLRLLSRSLFLFERTTMR